MTPESPDHAHLAPEKRAFLHSLNSLSEDSTMEEIARVAAMLRRPQGWTEIIRRTRLQCLPVFDRYVLSYKICALHGIAILSRDAQVEHAEMSLQPQWTLSTERRLSIMEEASNLPEGDTPISVQNASVFSFPVCGEVMRVAPQAIVLQEKNRKHMAQVTIASQLLSANAGDVFAEVHHWLNRWWQGVRKRIIGTKTPAFERLRLDVQATIRAIRQTEAVLFWNILHDALSPDAPEVTLTQIRKAFDPLTACVKALQERIA